GSVTITATSETKTGSVSLTIQGGIESIAAGGAVVLMLKSDGEVFGVGDNQHAQYAADGIPARSTPVSVMTGAQRILVAQGGGGLTALYIKRDKTLWGTGRDCGFGELGTSWRPRGNDACSEGYFSRTTPTQLATDVTRVAAGTKSVLYVKSDGTLWALGVNGDGAFGRGTYEHAPSAVQVATGVSDVWAAGEGLVFFRKTDGSVWGAGSNYYGQLGLGNSDDPQPSFTPVMTNVSLVATNGESSFFLKNDGSLWATGLNDVGQLGDGTLTDQSSPVQVMTGVAAVSAGNTHTMILKTDGTLWATGTNLSGELGDGTTTPKSTPVQVMTGVAQVAAGNNLTVVLKTDGSLWATGANSSGQLGTGNTTSSTTFVRMVNF
ncbi:MAG: RCC1 domain-containing protein, partial [Gemmatimonadaceae bacterium]